MYSRLRFFTVPSTTGQRLPRSRYGLPQKVRTQSHLPNIFNIYKFIAKSQSFQEVTGSFGKVLVVGGIGFILNYLFLVFAQRELARHGPTLLEQPF
jgi:hypothetical protein